MSMQQSAPYPHELRWVVEHAQHRPGWQLTLHDHRGRYDGAAGMTLEVLIPCVDTYDQQREIMRRHLFEVPAATWNRRTWQRWLFDRLCDVDRHEAMEFYMVDDVRVFEPDHPPYGNPYALHEVISETTP